MTEREEIQAAWATLEEFGFPPEACGWPFRDMAGVLPEAIRCALECMVRQSDAAHAPGEQTPAKEG